MLDAIVPSLKHLLQILLRMVEFNKKIKNFFISIVDDKILSFSSFKFLVLAESPVNVRYLVCFCLVAFEWDGPSDRRFLRETF